MTERRIGLLVLGMHRSGTSALTRVLSLLGCALPGDLLGEHDSNPTGHWESARAIRINDALLESLDRRWDDVRALPEDWMRRPGADVAREHIKTLIESEFGSAPLWVLKEPRLCLLAPLWMEVLDAMAIDVRVVVPLRDPGEVAASLERRDGIPPAASHLLWLRHLIAAEAASRSRPRVLMRFEELLVDWRAVTDHIAERLDIAWPQSSAASHEAIEAFLRPELRHAVSPAAESATPLPVALEMLHENLLAGDDDIRWKLIADAASQLDPPSGVYGPLIDALWRTGVQARGDLLAAQEIARRDASLGARVAGLESLLAQSEARIAELESSMAQREARAVDLARQCEEERGRSATLTQQLAQTGQQIAAKDGRMAQLERALVDTEETCRVMTGSRSWRLTRPLREMNSVLRKLRGTTS